MAKKNSEENSKKTAAANSVEGLKAEVVEQHITPDTGKQLHALCHECYYIRAIPEIDDFKPSHRKLLYTMYKMGLLNRREPSRQT